PTDRSQAVPPLFSRLAGGGVWPGRAARGRVDGPGRGFEAGGRDRGALVGSRVASPQGGIATPTREPRGPSGGSLFPASPRRGPQPAGQSVRVTGGAEPEPPMAAAGPVGSRPCSPGTALRLVHGRF